MLWWIKGLIVAGALFVGVSIKHFWPSYPDDNPIEEFAEQVIEHQIGMSVDITPSSPEKKI